MMRFLSTLFCLCLGASPAAAGEAPESTPQARAAIDEANGAILRGDAARAIDALSAIPEEQFRDSDRAQRACMLERLDREAPLLVPGEIDDAFVHDVLTAYQDYWWHALAEPGRRSVLENRLLARLRTRMTDAGIAHDAAGDIEVIEPVLKAALRERGYHALMGRTPPLLELMLWLSRSERRFDVELPEGRQHVRVDLLDDFVSLGWSAYGRCDYGFNGGWATEEKLFAVVPAYENLDGEAFQVIFLGHEAQHFADKHRFPDLKSWELEYRAKLVELAHADAVSEKRLRYFITAQSDDPNSPHTYANKRVVEHLRAKLGTDPERVPLAQLQAAARELLLEDSARRQKGVER